MALLSGGFLPPTVRGGAFSGLISVADWYGMLCELVGVSPHDPVVGLPDVDSVHGLWEALLVPNGTKSPRTELLLSYSCIPGASANASGCDPEAVSIFNSTADPTGSLSHGDLAFLSMPHKIIFGRQMGLGVWTGPVYPNGTKEGLDFSCIEGCLFDVVADPTEVKMPGSLVLSWLNLC